jgi:alpha-glucuronidase
MILVRLSLLFLLLFVAPWTSASDLLTHDSVKGLMESIVTNLEKRNAEDVVAGFTKDAQITLDLPERLGGRLEMNVKKYEDTLRQTFAVTSGYEFEVRKVKIIISPDRRTATVTDELHEKVQSNGIVVSSMTTEKATIVLDAGQPKVKVLYGHIRILSPL